MWVSGRGERRDRRERERKREREKEGEGSVIVSPKDIFKAFVTKDSGVIFNGAVSAHCSCIVHKSPGKRRWLMTLSTDSPRAEYLKASCLKVVSENSHFFHQLKRAIILDVDMFTETLPG